MFIEKRCDLAVRKYQLLLIWFYLVSSTRFPRKTRSTTAVAPPHLKSRITQRVGSHSNQKLLHTISIQKISSIHKFTLKVKHVLGSHELKSHDHFWIRPHKNNWIKFSLSQIRISIKKWLYPICSFFESRDQTGRTHFWAWPPKKFLISCTAGWKTDRPYFTKPFQLLLGV